MSDWREELIGKMADAMFASDENGTLRVDVMARAALAVAEPAMREQCAKLADAVAADYLVYRHYPHAEGAGQVVAAIRKGGKDGI